MTAESPTRLRAVQRAPLITGFAAILLAMAIGAAVTLGNGGEPFAVDAAWQELMLESRTPFTEGLALVLNFIGGGRVAVLVVPLAIAALFLVLRRPWAALFSLAAALASTLGVQLLKHLFARARPEEMLVHSDFGSFPSGHTANAAAIAVTFGVLIPRVWVWISGITYVVLMAWSRTLLGAHWLSDTIGGALIGAGVVLVLWAFSARWLEAERLGAARARESRRGGAA
ncbi:undecaprenyl-diphosphatase [Microterricola gilva]|uniref:Undecaprenyl-diphosphatase n=1 Tax=Microterricola gilva TaxID=393267 RepID=A0A4Q8AP18_9MICO|nr:phosphatase PAP2 family protein [Microterricola gilva]RZU66357.1 undecaprenyl-diphosphatase [Microterricola gilva]